jgi:hypothetical protein
MMTSLTGKVIVILQGETLQTAWHLYRPQRQKSLGQREALFSGRQNLRQRTVFVGVIDSVFSGLIATVALVASPAGCRSAFTIRKLRRWTV